MITRLHRLLFALTGASCWPALAGAQSTALQDEIVVTATRLPSANLVVPASVDRVAVDAGRDGRPLIDLSEVLNRVPGIVVQNRQNFAQDTQISARGFGARASFGIRGLKLFVDDIPASIPDGQGQGAIIPLFAVDNIEVMRGPWAVPYGNAAGGVISAGSIAPPQGKQLSFGTAAGPDHTRVSTVQAGAGNDAVAGRVATQHLAADGFRQHSRVRRDQTYARLDINPAAGHRLVLTGNLIHQPDTADPLGLTRAQFDADARQAPAAAIAFNTRKSIDHRQLGVVYDGHAGTYAWKLLAYGGYRDIEQFLSTPVAAQSAAASAGGVIALDRQFQGTGLRLSSTHESWSWTVGADADRAREARLGFENFVPSGGAATPLLGVRGRLRRDETNTQVALDGFAYFEWRISPAWKAHAALRSNRTVFESADRYVAAGNTDDSGERRYHRLTPAFALVHQLDPASRVYLSASSGFETPTAAELAYRADGSSGFNFSLAASANRQLELGFKQRREHAAINLAAFLVDTDDEIVPAASSAGRTTFQNGGRTSRRGIEAGVDWQFAQVEPAIARALALRIAYTFLHAGFRDGYRVADGGGRRVPAGSRLPGMARHQLFMEVAWRRGQPGASAALEWQARSQVYAEDANSAPSAAAGYGVMHARMTYALRIASWEFVPFVRVENILNRKYISSVIVNEANQRYFESAPTRRWLAGLNVSTRF